MTVTAIRRRLVCLSLLFAIPNLSRAEEPHWSLPAELSDANVKVTFEVDSTWHMVEGKTSNVTGVISQRDPIDWRSIQAHVEFPVSKFDTDNSMRDSKLREVMDEPANKLVTVDLDGLTGDCNVDRLPCSGAIHGVLTIRGKRQEVLLPYAASRVSGKGTVEISGETKFRWADFGIEDPSILIAKLDEIVTVKYQVTF